MLKKKKPYEKKSTEINKLWITGLLLLFFGVALLTYACYKFYKFGHSLNPYDFSKRK